MSLTNWHKPGLFGKHAVWNSFLFFIEVTGAQQIMISTIRSHLSEGVKRSQIFYAEYLGKSFPGLSTFRYLEIFFNYFQIPTYDTSFERLQSALSQYIYIYTEYIYIYIISWPRTATLSHSTHAFYTYADINGHLHSGGFSCLTLFVNYNYILSIPAIKPKPPLPSLCSILSDLYMLYSDSYLDWLICPLQ